MYRHRRAHPLPVSSTALPLAHQLAVHGANMFPSHSLRVMFWSTRLIAIITFTSVFVMPAQLRPSEKGSQPPAASSASQDKVETPETAANDAPATNPATLPATIAALQTKAQRLELASDPIGAASSITLAHATKSNSGKAVLMTRVFSWPAMAPAMRTQNYMQQLRLYLQTLTKQQSIRLRTPAINAVERFPARAAWLIERLDIDRSNLPRQTSSKVQEILTTLQPRSMNIVFPDAYLSSPASAFGHSLITLQGSNDNRLNDLAINYAAVTGSSGGLNYVARGITGGFSGKYSYMPYHQKMSQYAHGDQRNQWIYRLRLDHDEIVRVVQHLVELTDIASDYYFFDENCAFNILYLIEVGRPGVNLVTKPGHGLSPLIHYDF